MSKPLSTKKKIKIAVLLGGLSLVAIYSNSDVLFGQPLQPIKGGNAANNPPAAEAPAAPTPSSEGGSVTATSLGQRGSEKSEGKIRNPFQTLKEQDPIFYQSAPSETENANPEMPPGMRAQAILIYGKNRKIASIEGKQVEEGESFYGGKVALIEPTIVTIAFKGGATWLIPLGTQVVPREKR